MLRSLRSWEWCAALLIAPHILITRGATSCDQNLDDGYDVGANRCGPIALRLCAHFIGAEARDDELDRAVVCDEHGCSMLALADAAEGAGLHTLAVRWRSDLPPAPGPPAVIPIRLHDGRTHFVAMLAVRDGRALICDLGGIFGWVGAERLKKDMRWDGHALHVAAHAADIDALRTHIGSGRLGTASLLMPWAGMAISTFVLAVWMVSRVKMSRR